MATTIGGLSPIFSDEEYDSRRAKLRERMRERGVDALICTSPESIFYLSGYDANTAWSDQALVVRAGSDKPTLLIRDIDEPIIEGQVQGTDVALYNYGTQEPAEIVRSLVGGASAPALEYRGSGARLGYVDRLTDAIGGGTRLPDGSDLVSELRIRKSPAELEIVREAGRIADGAMDDAVAALRPGLTELQFAGEIEYALRKRNSEYPGMPTWMASGTKTACSHASPDDRVIQANAPLKCSFAAVRHRYHVTTYQSFYLGTPPDRYLEVFDQCREALDAVIAAIDVGVRFADASAAGYRTLDKYGLAEKNMGRWGYGVGIAYPPTWLEPMDITMESTGTFDVGMVFCMHTSMAMPEEGFGFTVGADYMVTESGVERVNRRAPEVIRIDV